MTIRALLYAYILGGVTFIPLVLIAVLGLGWSLLPKVDETSESEKKDGAKEKAVQSEDDRQAIDALLAKKHEEISEGGASGTFAVLRKYDFPAANAALTARNSAGGTAAGGGTTEDGGVEVPKESASVYQSVYRWGLGRTSTAQSGSVLENEEEAEEDTPNSRVRRRATPANIFYIVLRHGHLMLYDSAAQMEVRHVVSLAHHSVSLSEGGALPGTDEQAEEERNLLRDGDLFIKRTAIVLTPIDVPNGGLQSRNTPAKPFYLFSSTCSEKEDFYHSLLYTRAKPPIPEPLDPNDTIKLQSTLHSTSLTPETRAINALIGRIFLSLYHTNRAKDFIQAKIEKKISRVQKPAFIASLAVKSIDLGDSAPVLSNPRLKDLHISGDMTIACDVKYTGAIKLTIAAVAKIDLGQRFKTRTVDLVLATSLQRMQGHLLVRIKPPPSNRLWFCFESPPEMDIKVEPVVSQRQITYTFILRQIEDRIRAVISETLVKPNWDDIPFFDTRRQYVRGGIWRDEGVESQDSTEELGPSSAEILKERNTKTKSMPVLPGVNGETDSSGASSGSEATSKLASGHFRNVSEADANLKRRSVASLPAQSATPPPDFSSERAPPQPLRSPSFNSSSAPSVALDESSANVDPARNAEVPQKRWRIRGNAPQLPSRKEAVEAMREVKDKAAALREQGTEALTADKADDSATDRPRTADGEYVSGGEHDSADASATSPSSSQISFANRSLNSGKRTDTDMSSASSSSKMTQNQQRKQTILAATTAATNAARNWGWNAYQNAKKNSPARAGSMSSQQPEGQSQPMGRGQPLPPPGMPLPGPNKGLFGGFGGSIKRKPVLPPRSSTGATTTTNESAEKTDEKDTAHEGYEEIHESEAATMHPGEIPERVQTPMSDEFGDWKENTEEDHDLMGDEGLRVPGDDAATTENGVAAGASQKKAPPPLPPRRPTVEPDNIMDYDVPLDSSTTANSTHTGKTSHHDSEDLLDPNVAPPAQNIEQATAKFALGADVGEADFVNAPAHDSVLESNTDQGIQHGTDDIEPLDHEGEIVAIPAPIDEEDEMSDPVDIDEIAETAPPKTASSESMANTPAKDETSTVDDSKTRIASLGDNQAPSSEPLSTASAALEHDTRDKH